MHIKEVQTNADLKRFIAFPDKLYKGNEFKVTLLHSYEKAILSKSKNPALEFCELKMWLAYKNNKPVGRIAAFINWMHLETWNENYGRFGWVDFIDDYKVSEALFETAINWLRSKNVDAIHGPLGFTDMDMEGMLVHGFQELGTQAAIYNYPYYVDHIESLGFVKDVDWVQKEVFVPTKVPERIERMAEIVEKKYDLHPLKAKKTKDIMPYAKKIFYTLNKSFAKLYGFTPLNDKQIEYYIDLYFSIIKPEYICLVIDKKDDVVGFGISMPSLSKALIKAKGRILPFGFINLLKAINGKNDTIDMYLNGVRPDYQGKGVHTIYYSELAKAYIKNGITKAITNPQLESNTKAVQLWDYFEHRTHIRRRCYIKHLNK